MKRVLVVGELNVDVVLRGAVPEPGQEVLADDCFVTLGSASAICAMGLARLGNPVSFISRVGADQWGDYCIDTMTSAGIDTGHVHRDPNLRTGLTVSISGEADRALITYLGAIDAMAESDVPDALLDDARHLHVSSYFLQSRLRSGCLRLFARARQRRVTTSLDPGFDPHQQWTDDVRAAAHAADVFLPNAVELMAMTGCDDPAAALRRLDNGRTRIVVKLGSAGAMTPIGRDILHVPAFDVSLVDATGAGDSFNAGFLHGFLREWPPLECLLAGNACGALSTRAMGGTAGQPTLEEMKRFMHASVERR